ncbi:AAA family ATPase [Amycolatopsis sp. PS_44_ISF1]|uniref:AAA family ATPase n=1 Tax=Amycolatopsis sp. PS_44_ISF1 TaxID=2974917 RepID=UPI0028DF24CB|nr:AAA family ATPase [Amycolatopsis sp. PS_44_ISF1]MDT8913877.1 AAA family ATPase [Amycolatopsis sp. PS_44_ISF1]
MIASPMVAMSGGLPLAERETELAVLRSAVAGLSAGRSAYLRLSGPPGAGCSALLGQAIAAAGQDVRVLYAAGVPPTPGGPRTDVVGALVSALPDGVCQGPAGSADELCERFVTAARQQPLMLVFDGAEWMDERSWRCLRSLRRRLSWAPMLAVVAVGELGGPADSFGDLDAGSTVEQTPCYQLRLRSLSRHGVRRLLDAVPGRPSDPESARRLRDRTRGLPSVVRAAVLAAEPDLAVSAAVAGADWADRVLHLLNSGSGSDAVALARVIALCGEGFDWQLVCAAAGLSPSAAGRADAVLRELGLVEGPASGSSIRIAEPMVADRLLAGLNPAERAELYGRVLTLSRSFGTRPALLVKVALRAPPGLPGVGELLYSEARRLYGSNDYEEAVRLLKRALREPVADDVAAQFAIELAGAEAGTAPEAGHRRLARILLAEETTPAARLRAADMLVSQGRPEAAGRTLTTAARLPGLAPADRSTLGTLRRLISETAWDTGDYSFADGSAAVTPAEAAVTAWRLAVRNRDRTRALSLAEAALAKSVRAQQPLTVRVLACGVLLLAGATGEAAAQLDVALVEARRRCMRAAEVWAMLTRGAVALGQDRWDEAAQYFGWMTQVLPEHSWHPMVAGHARALRVTLDLVRGRLDDARSRLAGPLPAGTEQSVGGAQALYATGLVRLADGAPEQALDLFLECGRRMLSREWVNPVLVSWRLLAGIAYQACGRPVDAQLMVAEEQALARQWGEPGYLDRVGKMSQILEEQV